MTSEESGLKGLPKTAGLDSASERGNGKMQSHTMPVMTAAVSQRVCRTYTAGSVYYTPSVY